MVWWSLFSKNFEINKQANLWILKKNIVIAYSVRFRKSIHWMEWPKLWIRDCATIIKS
jgi:hypothetical protein